MYIIGENRPIINKSYTYFLRSTDISYEQVKIDNTRVANKNWLTKLIEEKPEPEPKIVWKIYLGTKMIAAKETGDFKFLVSNQKYTLVATIKNKEVARTTLHTLGGKPAIEVFWQDDYGQKIGNKTVGYLDKVYLKIKTKHIPVGDTLQVTIYEDEAFNGHGSSSHNMSTHTTTPVNKNGYAEVYFSNLQGFKVLMKKRDPNDMESEHEYYAKIAYASHLVEDADTIKDTIQLKVKNQLWKLIDPPVTNMPSMVGEVEKGGVPDTKKKIDFTFGIFIDGTLNNMYNSVARRKWEKDQTKKDNPTAEELLKTEEDISQDKIDTTGEQRYKYEEESSYENDLSNPAIIYQNYLENKDNKVFKIYSEGMGSNTVAGPEGADTNYLLDPKYYDEDDVAGYAAGQGKSGILDRVKRAVELMAEKIKVGKGEAVGTITVDVFGFSRGAAAARNFVHEITKPAKKSERKHFKIGAFYNPEIVNEVVDDNNYPVSEKYRDNPLPTNGRLGYILTENGVTFKELKIRFVGIYDTVPHHGVSQANDIADLGLNTIATKADFTVHLVAGDEHRLNFSLVDIRSIIGKKGGGISKKGVELYLPGVHCDVGGSYVEGRGEVNERLMVSNFSFLELDLTKERERLIQEGWFKLKDKNGPKEDEIYIHNDSLLRSTINQKIARVLTTDRKHLSNQYSYIPLHIMVDFCIKKGLVLDTGKIEKDYKFKTNSFSDAALLTRIEKQLKAYAAGTGERLKLVSPPIHHENDYVTSPENSAVARLEYEERIRAGQAKLDKIADDLNRDLKTLRNKYLHWNATYGEGFKKTASQANQPNFVGGKRKREIRG